MDIDIHALAVDSPGTAGNVAESEPTDCNERASSAQVWQLTFSNCGVLFTESRNSLLGPHITLLLSYVANYIYARTVLSSSVNLFLVGDFFGGHVIPKRVVFEGWAPSASGWERGDN